MIYYCNNCQKYIDEDDLKIKKICLEDEYGVRDLFKDFHYEDVYICPCCGSDDLEKLDSDEIIEVLSNVVDIVELLND